MVTSAPTTNLPPATSRPKVGAGWAASLFLLALAALYWAFVLGPYLWKGLHLMSLREIWGAPTDRVWGEVCQTGMWAVSSNTWVAFVWIGMPLFAVLVWRTWGGWKYLSNLDRYTRLAALLIVTLTLLANYLYGNNLIAWLFD